MNKIITCCLSSILFFSGAQSSLADSSVWHISKDGRELYLGGTIHVLAEKDYPLPCEFNFAYNRSGKLVFETDIGALESGRLAQQIARQSTYQDGQHLGNYLKPGTYRLLQDFASERGLDTAQLLRFRPGALMSGLMVNELARIGINADGVDAHYFRKARSDKKAIAWFEAPGEHMTFLLGLGKDNEDTFVRYLLSDLNKLELQLPGMIATWRDGDLAALEQASQVDRLKRLFPDIYDTLLSKRNKNWLPLIEQLMDTEETELVLVGALHMSGSEGLLNLMRFKGYKIKQLEACQP